MCRSFMLELPPSILDGCVEIDPYSYAHKPQFCWKGTIAREQKDKICQSIMDMASDKVYSSYGPNSQVCHYKILRVYWDSNYAQRLLVDVAVTYNPPKPVSVAKKDDISGENICLKECVETMKIPPNDYNMDSADNVWVFPAENASYRGE